MRKKAWLANRCDQTRRYFNRVETASGKRYVMELALSLLFMLRYALPGYLFKEPAKMCRVFEPKFIGNFFR